MVDIFDKEKRSEIMASIRSKNTAPELTVRKITFNLGFRYRLHQKDLPGKPDLVFRTKKKVIFVHGCFWHSHNCSANNLPQSNTDYWLPKLARNVERDKESIRELKKLGWKVLVIWECELNKSEKLAAKITKFLN